MKNVEAANLVFQWNFVLNSVKHKSFMWLLLMAAIDFTNDQNTMRIVIWGHIITYSRSKYSSKTILTMLLSSLIERYIREIWWVEANIY